MARLRQSEATSVRSASVNNSLYRDPSTSILESGQDHARQSPPSSDKENRTTRRLSKPTPMADGAQSSKRRRLADRENNIAYESSPSEEDDATSRRSAQGARVRNVPAETDFFDPFQSLEERRDIRAQFRELDKTMRDERAEWLKPESRGLQEAIRKQNKVYDEVKQTSEATIDSRLLVDAGDIAYRRSKHLNASDRASGIDIEELVGKCITFMTNGARQAGMRPSTIQQDDDEGDFSQNAALDWTFFGTHACMPFIKRPPTTSFLLGPLSHQRAPKAPRQRRERLQRASPVEAVRARELRAEDMSQAQNTSVTAACGRVMQTFRTSLERGRAFVASFWDGRDENAPVPEAEYEAFERQTVMMADGGLSLFKFVLHPESFGQTVENIFYLSFLIKDDGIKLQYDEDELPSLHLVNDEVREDPDRTKGDRFQQIFDLDYPTWQALVKINNVTKPMIADRTAEQAAARPVNSSGCAHPCLRPARPANAADMHPFVNLLKQVPRRDGARPVETNFSEKTKHLLPCSSPSPSFAPARRRSSASSYLSMTTRTRKTVLTCLAAGAAVFFVFVAQRVFASPQAGLRPADHGAWVSHSGKAPGRQGMELVRDLPPEMLPHDANAYDPTERKLVVVGDVHACVEELLTMMGGVGFKNGTDVLVLTGDLLSKGPDPERMLQLLREVNATTVRGNHDDRLIKEMARPLANIKPTNKPPTKGATRDEDIRRKEVADRLSAGDIEWLGSMPAMIRIRGRQKDTVVVHGGLVPGKESKGQSIDDVLELRTVFEQTSWLGSTSWKGTPGLKGRPWYEVWEESQNAVLAAGEESGMRPDDERIQKPLRVLYGHDSSAEVSKWKWSVGMNSKCVKGGKLSALVMHGNGKEELVQLSCPKYA